MKKLVATKIFYSYQGYDEQARIMAYGHGSLEKEEINSEIEKTITNIAKKNNPLIESVQIISVTPIEFEEIEDALRTD
jgi:uncharacterized protein YwgA